MRRIAAARGREAEQAAEYVTLAIACTSARPPRPRPGARLRLELEGRGYLPNGRILKAPA
jgi:hypothetical protein